MTPDFFNGFERIDNLNKIDIHKYTDKFFNNYEYVVIWFGRIFRGSNRQNAVKLIEVKFLNLSNGYTVEVRIPIELAHRLTIGSIWVNGVTHQKFDFDDALTVINEKSDNLTYSNHFGISKEGGTYEFALNNYPVVGLESDTNTLLVINQGSYKVIIHPLLFYMAHYGISKEVNRVLLTDLWVDIEESLNLNHPNPEISNTVIIPDKCVIADAVFLHHLKHDKHTKTVTKQLNKRVLDAFIKSQNNYDLSRKSRLPSAPLKVVPYHEQQIEIGFKGINIEDGVMLCTEITGMSMPRGDAISYAFNEYEKKQGDLSYSESAKRSYRALFNKIDANKLVIEAESNAGNSTTAVVLQHIYTIGEIRELVRAENITIQQFIQRQSGQVIPLTEPVPSTYAIGEKSGTNNTVGMLKIFISSGVVAYKNPLFKKLLGYAQSLRADTEYPRYNHMVIDCYSNGRLYGESVEQLNQYHGATYVTAIYILKLVVNRTVYYIFDCSMTTWINTSGICIKVNNDDYFMSYGVNDVLEQLFTNNGRLLDQDELERLYGSIVKFNHTGSESSNWVRTALEKLNNPSAKE